MRNKEKDFQIKITINLRENLGLKQNTHQKELMEPSIHTHKKECVLQVIETVIRPNYFN